MYVSIYMNIFIIWEIKKFIFSEWSRAQTTLEEWNLNKFSNMNNQYNSEYLIWKNRRRPNQHRKPANIIFFRQHPPTRKDATAQRVRVSLGS